MAKCYKTQEKVCLKALNDEYEFDPNYPVKDYSDMAVQGAASYIYYTYWTAKIFTAPATDTWFEVTGHCQLNFRPLWFPGTTVFQLPVNVAGDPKYEDDDYFGLSSFSVEVEGGQKSLVTYKIPRSWYPWVKSFTPNEAKESTMRMQIQKSLIHSDDLSTGTLQP